MKKCQETEILFNERRKLLEKARDHIKASVKKRTSFRQSLKYHLAPASPNNDTAKDNNNISEPASTPDITTIPDINSEHKVNNTEEINEKSTVLPAIEEVEKPTLTNTATSSTVSPATTTGNSQGDGSVKSKNRPRKMLKKSASMCSPRSTVIIGSPLVTERFHKSGKS